MRCHNFYPGPSALPIEVLHKTQAALLEYGTSGVGILELSHRSTPFIDLLTSTEQQLRNLLSIPKEYEVLFTTGGATQQFSMVPMNLVPQGQTANYLITGSWAQKAYDEAQKFAPVHCAANGTESGFSAIPKEFKCSENAAYLHYTSNNTIYGTRYALPPQSDSCPLVCDASSDLLSREVDVAHHALIYAAAQKNFGPSGITLVVLRRELLSTIPEVLPLMLDYRTYANSKSLYNTPPTFAIYVVHEMLNWISQLGGLAALGKRNEEKAGLIYEAIDRNDLYRGYAAEQDRSPMNITFTLPSKELESLFLQESLEQGFLGLAGHRSIGGLRVSLYNGLPPKSASALAEFMAEFARTKG